MTALVIGLIVFLGIHSIRVFAEPLRSSLIERMGANGYKGFYTVVAIVGLGLIIWGYPQTRLDPVDLWYPPVGMKHLATLLTWLAFVAMAAASFESSYIKGALRHPMTIGVKLWAFAHLLANGRLGDVVLFGAFLLWAVLVLIAARRRDRAAVANGTVAAVTKSWAADAKAVVGGTVVWAVFALFIHGWWIGVRPFG